MKLDNFSNYEFYENGDIFSYHSKKFLRKRIGKDNYYSLSLYNDKGEKITHSLNNWICRAFHGQPPFEGAEAMHIDENPLNCSSNNLKWGSHQENINYGERTFKNAISHYKKIGQYNQNEELIAIYSSIKEASEKTGVSYTGIIKCAKGNIKTSGDYKWHYIPS